MFNFLHRRKAEKKVLKLVKETGDDLNATMGGLLELYILAGKYIKENKEKEQCANAQNGKLDALQGRN